MAAPRMIRTEYRVEYPAMCRWVAWDENREDGATDRQPVRGHGAYEQDALDEVNYLLDEIEGVETDAEITMGFLAQDAAVVAAERAAPSVREVA